MVGLNSMEYAEWLENGEHWILPRSAIRRFAFGACHRKAKSNFFITEVWLTLHSSTPIFDRSVQGYDLQVHTVGLIQMILMDWFCVYSSKKPTYIFVVFSAVVLVHR